MTPFKRYKIPNGVLGHYHKARARLMKISPAQVTGWTHQNIWAQQSMLEQYERSKDPVFLREARVAAAGVLAGLDDLLDRQG